MRIVRAKDYEDMSKKAADIMASEILLKPNVVLGLATGSTPVGAYQELANKCKAGRLDFSNVITVNLDEYKGLPKENDQSYVYFMNDNLFQHINIDLKNTYLPDGTIENSDRACQEYDDTIARVGGIDMQLLGLGNNGHIGFNEPCDVFKKNTNCVSLTDNTIEANKRFFASADDVPRQAYTMGIGTIMAAKRILLVVSGEGKAKALQEALYGDITPQVPASILQLHEDVVVVADEAALSLCKG